MWGRDIRSQNYLLDPQFGLHGKFTYDSALARMLATVVLSSWRLQSSAPLSVTTFAWSKRKIRSDLTAFDKTITISHIKVCKKYNSTCKSFKKNLLMCRLFCGNSFMLRCLFKNCSHLAYILVPLLTECVSCGAKHSIYTTQCVYKVQYRPTSTNL